MELIRIPTQELDKAWGLVDKDIRQALAYSSQLTDSDFVFETAKQNKFQVWILWDKNQKKTFEKYFGVCVTEIRERKFGKVCHIFIMTGRQRHKWQKLVVDTIEDFAKNEECKKMELVTRPGWQKFLQNLEYKRTHVVLEKQIKQEEDK